VSLQQQKIEAVKAEADLLVMLSNQYGGCVSGHSLVWPDHFVSYSFSQEIFPWERKKVVFALERLYYIAAICYLILDAITLYDCYTSHSYHHYCLNKNIIV